MGEWSARGTLSTSRTWSLPPTTWESKRQQLEEGFNETVSNGMHIAVLTLMMPTLVQDFVDQTVDERTKAEDLQERIKSCVRNEVAMDQGPTPMDVGNINGQQGDEEHWQDEDIQGVRANMQCHKCGGWGHLQRE